ncbi:MAG: SRPBCC domain-containing protein [Spirochaetota bacterium]
MSETTVLQLEVSKVVAASREQVFQAWLDAKMLQQFMIPGEGMQVGQVEVDAREGGDFLLVMQAGEDQIPHRGTYKKIQKFEELAFTWVSAYTQEDSLVELFFKELSPKETEVTLRHSNFPNEASRDNHQGGWASILEKLEQVS